MTPMTGWLAGRFGRKQVFMTAIIGFTIASALCGAAQSLGQIVGFRLLQGAFGAALVPLSAGRADGRLSAGGTGPRHGHLGHGRDPGPIVARRSAAG